MTTPKKPIKPRKTAEPSNNVQALQATLKELKTTGRLDNIDSARVRIALGLAAAVDSAPDNPTLWREYRAAEKALREETETNADPFDELIRQLSAPMGNEKKQKTQNPRP
jgi:hypothetical protein